MERRTKRAEELARQIDEEAPDETTRREALEQELMDEGLSEEGAEIGEHIDQGDEPSSGSQP
jgi:hypothetical protein